MKNQKNIIILVLILVVLAGALLYTSTNRNQSQTPKTEAQTKTFQSKELKFIIGIPQVFQIKASTTGVDLLNQEGSIEIIRNGTQFPNLTDYLKDFDSKRKIKVKSSEKISIAEYEVLRRTEERVVGGESKNPLVYYIWVDSFVYIVSTDSQPLFNSLDQIAQSFRYVP